MQIELMIFSIICFVISFICFRLDPRSTDGPNMYHKKWKFGEWTRRPSYDDDMCYEIIPQINICFNVLRSIGLGINIRSSLSTFDIDINFLCFNLLVYGFYKPKEV